MQTVSEAIEFLHYVFPGPHFSDMYISHNVKFARDACDEAGFTTLHYAAFQGNENIVRKLLRNGADVGKATNAGLTPLHTACLNPDEECMKAILEYNPSVNALCFSTDTPLCFLIEYSAYNERVLEILLQAGGDPNLVDWRSCSPLHMLAMKDKKHQSEAYARLLIKYNANVNSKTELGATPLVFALMARHMSVIKVLLEHGGVLSTEEPPALTEGTKHSPIIADLLAKEFIRQFTNKIYPKEEWYIESMQQIKTELEEELLELKNTRIGESSITYNHILIASPVKIAKYLNNPEIMKKLTQSKMTKYKFGPTIIGKVQEGKRRLKTLKFGYIFLRKLCSNIPDDCMDVIISELSTEYLCELKRFILEKLV